MRDYIDENFTFHNSVVLFYNLVHQCRSACAAIGISPKVRLANKSEPDALINLNLPMLSEKAGSILLEQDLGA